MLLYGKEFLLRMKGTVYKSYVRPAILYGSEAWSLKESKMENLQKTERSMVSAMCEVQLNDLKRVKDMMLILGLNEAVDQLTMANSVRWYGHVVRRALNFEAKGYRKEMRPIRTGKNHGEGEGMVGVSRQDSHQ